MKKIFLSAAIAALALSSCNKENTAEISTEPVAVQFTNGVITRASGAEWANGDQIGIYMFTTSTTTPYGDNSNVEYYNSAEAGSTATFSVVDVAQTIYYPLDGTNVDFVAYYPYSSTQVSATDYVYSVDVNSANQANPTEIDLLVSNNLTNKAVNSTALEFNFYHALAQLEVVVNSGVGSPSLDGLGITVKGLINSAEYTITSDYIDFGTTTATDLTIIDQEAIVIPQTAEISFVVTTTDNTAGYETTSSSVKFEQGKITTVTLTLNRTGVNFEGDSTITDWVGSDNDEAFDAEQPEN